MKLLLDTHILVCGAAEPERLPMSAVSLIENPDNEVVFSVVSLWVVAQAPAQDARTSVDAGVLRRNLFDNGDPIPMTIARGALAL